MDMRTESQKDVRIVKGCYRNFGTKEHFNKVLVCIPDLLVLSHHHHS